MMRMSLELEEELPRCVQRRNGSSTFVNTEEEPTSNSCRHLAAVEQPDVYFFKIR
jgi:hypothetical protein